MLAPAEAVHAIKVQKTDAMPYAATVIGMLTCGLAEGIGIGLVTSLIFSGANWNQPQTAWMSYKQAEAVRVQLETYSTANLMELTRDQLIRLIRPGFNQGSSECP